MENETEAPFVIPESAFGPIRDLVDLTEENFDAFMAGLSSASPTVSTNALSRHISRSAAGIPRSVVQALVGEIMTLEYLKQDSEMEPMEFASGLSASALEAVSEDFKFDAPDAEILTKRVFRIFSSDHVLQLTTKAITVMTDHSHLFLSAKILTDARPVFSDDGAKLEAMAIVHNLRIHFEHNQNHEDFFAALDAADLKKLRSVIERAEKKSVVLREMFKANEICYLDVEHANIDD